MTRQERAVKAAELRAQGLVYREIAERMGISISYAAALITDPDDRKARERKARYRKPCRRCGKLTNPGGPQATTGLCRPCAEHEAHETSVAWLVAEIRHWNDLYGRPPSASDWNLGMMRRRNLRYDRGEKVGGRFSDERIAEAERRHREDGPWPTDKAVNNTFGTWNAAIEAAGFESVAVGGHRDPEEWYRRRFGKVAA